MKNNSELQKDVQNAIQWEPLLHAAEIGVVAKDGIVSLTGIVDSLPKKLEAENAAKKVVGVNALVENIIVKFPSSWSKSDAKVAQEILHGIRLNWAVPDNKVSVKVEDGWVTISGELPWNYQREATKNSVKHLIGVKGITNNIEIKSERHDKIEQKEVEDAIARSWNIGNHNISVQVSGTTVTLTGSVHSWYQHDEAAKIMWNTPGVWHVENELTVEHYPL
jgi:osmotically-inducible protein OsmY